MNNIAISSAPGVILGDGALSTAAMTMTLGNLTTTAANLLTVTGTTVGALTYTAGYINGPFARTLPLSLASGSTYLFPIGKSAYKPLELVNPTTNAGGTVVVQGEVFDADCGGTPGVNMSSLNTDRYWNTTITSGSGNFTNTTVRLTEAGLTGNNGIGESAILAGAYNLISSAVPTPTTIISDAITSLGYLAIGIKSVPMAYVSSTTTQASVATLLQNSTNQAVIGIQVVTSGNASPIDVTKFTVNANGTGAVGDISNAKIWYTGASSTFAATTQFGLTFSSPTLTAFDITGTQTLASGTNYFWLTFDIPLNATATHTVDAECTVVAVAGADQTPTSTAPAGSRTITINPPTGFSATTISSSEIDLLWVKNSVGQDVMVATNTTNSFGALVNGVVYTGALPAPEGGTVIYQGPASAFPHTALASNTHYYYKVWSVDANSYYSSTGPTANATTFCATINSFPFTESFAATLGCWTYSEGVAGASYHWGTVTSDATHGVAAAQSGTGTYFARIDIFNASTSYNPYYLTSPSFALDATVKQLKYYYWLGSSGNQTTPVPLTVQISVNGGSWTDIYTHTSANSVFGTTSTSPWTQNTISLAAYTGQTIKFRFVSQSNYGSGYCNQGIDEFLIENVPSCPPPTMTPATNISANSATINWTAPSPAPSSGYDIYYSTSSTAPTVSTTPTASVGAGVTSYPTGPVLSSFTAYYVWVRSNCGSDLSSWAGPYMFTTNPAPYTLPFTETFESTSAIPNGWRSWQSSGTGYSWTGTTGGVTSGCAYSGYYGTIWMISNAITVPAGGSVDLSFYQKNSYATDYLKHGLYYSTTGAQNLAAWTAIVADLGVAPTIWTVSNTFTITGYPGTTLYVAFEYEGDNADGWYVDNFHMEVSPVTWTGSVSSNWSTTGNWNPAIVPTNSYNVIIPPVSLPNVPPVISGTPAVCNNLTINSGGLVTVADGGALTVNGTMTNSSSPGIILSSTGSGTGSLIFSTPGVTGIVQRYIAQWGDISHGWHLLSSPVASQAIQPNFVPNPPGSEQDFYAWDEVNGWWFNSKDPSLAWVPAFDAGFIPGKGYLVAYGSDVTKPFTGTLNVANVTVASLTNSPGPAYPPGDITPGWNLLGNPFTSALTWPAGWTLSNVSTTAKVWKETDAAYVDISVAAGNQIIPATQGFMVEVLSVAGGSVTIPASARTHNPQASYKSTGNPYIKLVAHNFEAQTAQESVVTFNDQATPGYNPAFDSHFLSGYAPSFYSVDGTEKLSTNVLPGMNDQTTIPFNFIKTDGSNYSIEAVQIDNVPAQVFLTDLKINQTQNLVDNPVYTFTASDGDDPARFLLSFSHVGVDENTLINNRIYAYENNLYIVNPGKARLEVYNLTGQKLLAEEINCPGLSKTTLYVPTGYYVVRLTTGTKVVVTKVFIKS